MAPDVLVEMGLEWDQMTGAKRPYGRLPLNRSTKLLLVALRIYAIVAIPVVAYAFVRSLQ